MGKDIRSSSSQDCRHLKQQQSYVKDPFRGWRLLGRVIRSGRRRSAQGHFMEGNLLTGVKSLSTLCYHSVSVEAQWTDDIHIQKCSHFPFILLSGAPNANSDGKRGFLGVSIWWHVVWLNFGHNTQLMMMMSSAERPQRCATLLWNWVRLRLLVSTQLLNSWVFAQKT